MAPTMGATLKSAGQAANEQAAKRVFEDYRRRKAAATVERQKAALAKFAEFLGEMGVEVGDLMHDPTAWDGLTWGVVLSFRDWLVDRGFAIGTVNARLSTLKTYAKLMARAQVMDRAEYAMIRAVEGYRHAEARHVDEERRANGTPTRQGAKKADPVTLTAEQVQRLKDECDDDAQGRRDRLMLCILLDHGLRVGELAGLRVEDFDVDGGVFVFFREKVSKQQTHRLSSDTLAALRAYLQDAPESGLLLCGSRRGGRLTEPGMSRRSITRRVRALGEQIGVEGLSAHDLRHTWATLAARNGTALEDLAQAGGWSSLAMPARYIEDAEIANERVELES